MPREGGPRDGEPREIGRREGGWRVRLAQPRFPALDHNAVAAVLSSGWLTNGEQVGRFEEEFARYQGVAHAVAVSSCTAALHLALLAHGVGPGDEVATSAFTFAATCNAIVHAGATPVLVDVDPDTLNIDIAQLERAITPRTRAVIIVHFAGQPVDMTAVLRLRDTHRFALIHDAAHATEARHGGRSIGAVGGTACFSFYATKNLPIGEGGMLTTADAAIARTARVLRSHGMSLDAYQRREEDARPAPHGGDKPRWRHWDMSRPGYNYKMTELAALLGRGQLAHLDAWRDRRAWLADRYDAALTPLAGLRVCGRGEDIVHAHHLFVVRVVRDDVERDLLAPQLRAAGIEVAVNYRAIHELAWYRETYGWQPADFPVACRAGRCCITLPLHPDMTAPDVDAVVATLRGLLPA
jgi:dTDP-4-amino-4,6-dideoxygalactose transaminase